LPYSSADRLKLGKRISMHPLHEAFLGQELNEKKLRDEYYQRTEPGALVADLDAVSESRRRVNEKGDRHTNDPLARLQRVFTAPIDRLVKAWSEAAIVLSSKRREQD
jgi:hypothetical protein